MHESFNNFQALRNFLRLQLTSRFFQVITEHVRSRFKIDVFEQLKDRLSTNIRCERVFTELVASIHILFFREKLLWFERRQRRLDYDIAFEVKYALYVFQRHVEQKRDTGRK